ncbi:hypothetical protein [Methylobacterium symbioticum]|uniref:Uncharacterized protein n=1 Tax=Methylobacterium symbioticum TaxID=2584084 RepID=A0A509EC55_9HYPH|nr:hypothetical protein [Methylobacterium symbioticum]VUD71837.1 hypothetical protein MET9862_02425 [Methylobacterium symbioticum]
MAQPSREWIAEQERAERELVDRFADLDAVIMRVEGYALRAAESARALSAMPNCDGTLRLREANDLRQVLAIAKHHQSNLDRVHLLEEPNRRPKPTQRAGGRP